MSLPAPEIEKQTMCQFPRLQNAVGARDLPICTYGKTPKKSLQSALQHWQIRVPPWHIPPAPVSAHVQKSTPDSIRSKTQLHAVADEFTACGFAVMRRANHAS